MRIGPAPSRVVAGPEPVGQAVLRFEKEWTQGRPDLDRHRGGNDLEGSLSLLAALVKADLRCRYERGECPAASEYLDRYPELRAAGDRVLSLVYEEYCLREEHGGRPEAAEFCARYGPWADSLESQLRYHRVLSRVAGSAPPRPPVFPEEGEHFGPFLIRAELGRGGAGRVYLACDESLGGREVALKVSHDRGNEPSILGRLEHPHIVPVHSVVRHCDRDGTVLRGLCMNYRPGLPLDEVIRRVNPAARPGRARALHAAFGAAASAPAAVGGAGWATFPERGSYADGVAWVVAVLAEALAYAHARRIFHRDVKPANVLLTYRGGPQLLDFNLSHDPHSATEAEEAARGGTLPYMAPEQLDAFLNPARWGDVAEPADLYSLGLMLRELLTGRAPEPPDPTIPLTRAIRGLLDRRADFRADLRRLNPSVPHALDAIAGRCLAFAPADRYRDAGSLAEDLRRYLARRPLKYARNRSARERAAHWFVRNRTPLAASALLVAAAIAVGTAVRRDDPAPAPSRPTRVESRPEFQKAADALDAGQPAAALAILSHQGAEAWDSPPAVFLTAVAHARVGQLEDARVALVRFWSLRDAEVALVAWGRSRPALAGHAEKLGREVFSPDLGPAALDRVEWTFKLARRLNPGTIRACVGLAEVERYRKNYPDAHTTLTGVIRTLDRLKTPDRNRQLLTSLKIRAKVSTLWAPSLPLPDADDRLAEALGDLDRADGLAAGGDNTTRFDLTLVRCETTLARVEVAARRQRYHDALEFYRQAEHLLSALDDLPADRGTPDSSYQNRRKEQLRDEMRRIKTLIPDAEPRAANGTSGKGRRNFEGEGQRDSRPTPGKSPELLAQVPDRVCRDLDLGTVSISPKFGIPGWTVRRDDPPVGTTSVG